VENGDKGGNRLVTLGGGCSKKIGSRENNKESAIRRGHHKKKKKAGIKKRGFTLDRCAKEKNYSLERGIG